MYFSNLGFRRFREDIEMMLGKTVFVRCAFYFFAPMWCVITPLGLLVSLTKYNSPHDRSIVLLNQSVCRRYVYFNNKVLKYRDDAKSKKRLVRNHVV